MKEVNTELQEKVRRESRRQLHRSSMSLEEKRLRRALLRLQTGLIKHYTAKPEPTMPAPIRKAIVGAGKPIFRRRPETR